MKIKLTQKGKELIGLIGSIASIYQALPSIVKIFALIFGGGSIAFAYIYFLWQSTLDLLIKIIQLPIWQIQIIPRLWQVLILLPIIACASLKIYKRYKHKKLLLIQKENENTKHRIRYHTKDYSNIKWKWRIDELDRVVVDYPPMCKKCDRKLIQCSYDDYRYKCPSCNNDNHVIAPIRKMYLKLKNELKSQHE